VDLGERWFKSKDYFELALMYRDWGRIGDNSERIDERFVNAVDGIIYDSKFLYGVLGYKFKSSEVNAAFGLVQLNRL
jgi:CDP-4-dehydro-6-deoxyglucose reductase, E1